MTLWFVAYIYSADTGNVGDEHNQQIAAFAASQRGQARHVAGKTPHDQLRQ
jgi:hypothetical protein